MHVVDGSDAMPEKQVSAVREVLAEINEESGTPMPRELLVVNKIDAVGDVGLARLRHLFPDASFVSAHAGLGIEELRARIAELMPRPEVVVEALVPYARGEVVARVHRDGEVLSEKHTESGTLLSARVRPDLAGLLEEFATNGSPA